MKSLGYYIKNPRIVFEGLTIKFVGKLLPDKTFIKLLYHYVTGNELDLENPKTFTEKLQWLKINDKNPLYPTLVDKISAKKWVAEKIGGTYIIPTLCVWDRIEDVDFSNLPDKFVLKCNHNSGNVIICQNRKSFDVDAAKRALEKSLNDRYYLKGREWPYKYVKPRVFAEIYMSPSDIWEYKPLIDYKFYCFNGVPMYVQVIKNRGYNETVDFYNMNWEKQPFTGVNPTAKMSDKVDTAPSTLENMKEVAAKLSMGFPFMRVDLYEINHKVYFGELTLYPSGGFGCFKPKEYNLIIGNQLRLSI